jgi:hypothetical protein
MTGPAVARPLGAHGCEEPWIPLVRGEEDQDDETVEHRGDHGGSYQCEPVHLAPGTRPVVGQEPVPDPTRIPALPGPWGHGSRLRRSRSVRGTRR